MLNKPLALFYVAALAASAAPLGAAEAPASDRPDDYRHALPLSVSGKESVVQLRLPKEVYLHARTADLRDLRLFDAQGNKLPFSLQEPVARAERSRRDLPVRLFGVQTARPAGSTADIDIDVQRSGDGTVLSVSTRSRPAAAASGIDTLVLDLGAPATSVSIDALRFTLPAGVSSYSARVVLEVSDDLKRWDTVGETDLSWLVNERTETLASDRMDFEARSFRYARLGWRQGKPLQFAAISAESPLNTALAPAVERLVIQPKPGRFPNDHVYPSSLAIPVQRIGLDLGEQNVVMPAQLGRYVELPDRQGGRTTTWHFEPLAAATFYQLTQGGRRRASGDISITPAHQAEWVLRTETAGTAAPALRLAWSPATVVFLANGKPPYRLAFGRADAKPGASALAQVAPGFTPAEIAALESAVAGPLESVKAGAADAPGAAEKAAAAARTRMFGLWAALLAGVGVLSFMAWRLIKQMK
ncbi:DUF3999 family protein [Massilia pseudoviolaceinigra]|uniref:DUF3999 family protein n=1 Tax=Massilia pseudoviolaceinigra TaxID=3057165 RepID=UPI0027966BFE|nr:DUF3999 family protein [Massilia sp. CCM 9206]MDQ1921502.1 DUF3999 family protein [Massilia sp. CCM 9206]